MFVISVVKTLSTLAFSVAARSLPSLFTGLDAPIVVDGAIAAMCAARVTSAPAEAAYAPGGVTYEIIGTVLLSSAVMIACIESIAPPGVLTSITSACAPSPSAVAMALTRKRWEAASIWVFNCTTSTLELPEAREAAATGWLIPARANRASSRAGRTSDKHLHKGMHNARPAPPLSPSTCLGGVWREYMAKSSIFLKDNAPVPSHQSPSCIIPPARTKNDGIFRQYRQITKSGPRLHVLITICYNQI